MQKQNQWRSCRKCKRLVHYDPGALPACPQGGKHDHTGSLDFVLDFTPASNGGLNSLLRCNKCRTISLFLDGTVHCTEGGGHNFSGSPAFVFDTTLATGGGFDQWLRCIKCRTLTFLTNDPPPCPEGGGHNFSGSPAFVLNFVPLGSYRLDITSNGLPVESGQPAAFHIENGSGQTAFASAGTVAVAYSDGTEMSIFSTAQNPGAESTTIDIMQVQPFGSEIRVGQVALNVGDATTEEGYKLGPDGQIASHHVSHGRHRASKNPDDVKPS